MARWYPNADGKCAGSFKAVRVGHGRVEQAANGKVKVCCPNCGRMVGLRSGTSKLRVIQQHMPTANKREKCLRCRKPLSAHTGEGRRCPNHALGITFVSTGGPAPTITGRLATVSAAQVIKDLLAHNKGLRIMQVHDEIVVESPTADAAGIRAMLAKFDYSAFEKKITYDATLCPHGLQKDPLSGGHIAMEGTGWFKVESCVDGGIADRANPFR